MTHAPDNLKHELAALYQEPVSDADASMMADRLVDFVGLLLEIQAESQGCS